MHPRTPDRRTKRTADALHVALNTLVLEKGYGAVSVKDITDRANVGRSTFYEHHSSKHGLLLHGLDHLRPALAGAPSNKPADPLRASLAFFAHVSDYRDIFKALASGPAGSEVIARLKRILSDAMARDLRDNRGRRAPAIPEALAVRVAVDSAFSLLTWWLMEHPEVSAKEIADWYRQLVAGVFPD